jgi:hypothetical protein
LAVPRSDAVVRSLQQCGDDPAKQSSAPMPFREAVTGGDMGYIPRVW